MIYQLNCIEEREWEVLDFDHFHLNGPTKVVEAQIPVEKVIFRLDAITCFRITQEHNAMEITLPSGAQYEFHISDGLDIMANWCAMQSGKVKSED